jgi:hypothetical protein
MTMTTIAGVLAVACFVFYVMRRRARLSADED